MLVRESGFRGHRTSYDGNTWAEDSVVFSSHVIEARVTRVLAKRKKLWWSAKGRTGTLWATSGEGREWARGWDTPEADALRAAVALDS